MTDNHAHNAESVPPRFEVRRTLPNLWEVTDRRRDLVEFVLFADLGLNYARLWVTGEVLDHGGRNDALRLLAEDARRGGVQHSFRPPPLPAPTYVITPEMTEAAE